MIRFARQGPNNPLDRARSLRFLSSRLAKAFRWLSLPLFVAAALAGPCDYTGELLNHGHMDLGVRFDIHDARIVEEFKNALNFWSRILDMEWHEDSNSTCSVDLVDGTRNFINGSADVLRQKSIARGVQSSGTVAVDSGFDLSPQEWYAISVHELGHLFGLHHNSNANSIMYYMSVRGDQALDATDIAALSQLHRMKISLNWLQP